jgi:hypothetical protein
MIIVVDDNGIIYGMGKDIDNSGLLGKINKSDELVQISNKKIK